MGYLRGSKVPNFEKIIILVPMPILYMKKKDILYVAHTALSGPQRSWISLKRMNYYRSH